MRHSGASEYFKALEGSEHHKELNDGSHLVQGYEFEGIWFPASDVQIGPRKTVSFHRLKVKPNAWIKNNMRKKNPNVLEYVDAYEQAANKPKAPKKARKRRVSRRVTHKVAKPLGPRQATQQLRERFERNGLDYDYLKNLSEKYAKECIRLLAKKEYEMGPLHENKAHYLKKAVSDLKIEYINGNYRSHWTRGEIKLNFAGIAYKASMKKFYEYSAFKDDPVIGERSIQNIEEALFLTVAHEIAHFVQYEIAPRVPRFRNTYRKSHGDGFKAIYRYLRKDLVNDRLA